MSPVVSNTTPISNLLRIGQLPLLLRLFGEILIPSQVAAELTRGQPILGTWQEAPAAQSITVIEAAWVSLYGSSKPLTSASASRSAITCSAWLARTSSLT